MDEDEPQGSLESLPTKSPKEATGIMTKSRDLMEHLPRRSVSPAYTRRQQLYTAPPQCKSYTIEPVCAIPHPVPTNALASSLCMSHLLTGSDDGYIRDYDIFSACNGRTYLTAPQRSHCGLGDTMMKAGILRCWWPATTQEKHDTGDLTPVYSLVCHSDALWALSGGVSGEIHLYTVRHEPGRIHYTFDEHKAAVSALALSSDEKSVFSAGHDGLALQLDLDRGIVSRRFDHPGAQITALGLRPYYPFTLPEPAATVVRMSPENEEIESKPPHQDESGDIHLEEDAPAVAPIGSPTDGDNKSDAYDPLFDDVDGNTASVQPSPNASQATSSNALGLALPGRSRTASLADQTWPTTQSAPAIKHGVGLLDPVKYADYSNDLLMTATFGGSLFLWDRRVQGKVGRLENDRTPPWCISACWSATGNEIIVGRRNATVDVFDVRQFGNNHGQNPRLLRTLVNPSDSKTVTCVAAFPDGKHMVCASEDNIRLWNILDAPAETWRRKGLPPFRVIPGHHGGLVSQILIDIRTQFMITASSARQWPGQSTRTVLIHDIQKNM
ncbi:WD40 repeat-like protein [Serendipita vermifera]|nr:WD40 repeat-like protein [Serendipita vermifera]